MRIVAFALAAATAVGAAATPAGAQTLYVDDGYYGGPIYTGDVVVTRRGAYVDPGFRHRAWVYHDWDDDAYAYAPAPRYRTWGGPYFSWGGRVYGGGWD
jgi:hypothetical protein